MAFSVLYLDDFSRLIVPLTHLHSRSGAGVEKTPQLDNFIHCLMKFLLGFPALDFNLEIPDIEEDY